MYPPPSVCILQVGVTSLSEIGAMMNGLRYSVVQKDLSDSPLKEGIATLRELEASDMSSPLYTLDDNVNRVTTVVLQSYLFIDESGYYAFRVRSNNPNNVGNASWLPPSWTGFA